MKMIKQITNGEGQDDEELHVAVDVVVVGVVGVVDVVVVVVEVDDARELADLMSNHHNCLPFISIKSLLDLKTLDETYCCFLIYVILSLFSLFFVQE
jgi:hypothetical protein